MLTWLVALLLLGLATAAFKLVIDQAQKYEQTVNYMPHTRALFAAGSVLLIFDGILDPHVRHSLIIPTFQWMLGIGMIMGVIACGQYYFECLEATYDGNNPVVQMKVLRTFKYRLLGSFITTISAIVVLRFFGLVYP